MIDFPTHFIDAIDMKLTFKIGNMLTREQSEMILKRLIPNIKNRLFNSKSGLGRDRTGDLTIFSRSLVPTELPSQTRF